jgi:hypothetical protein
LQGYALLPYYADDEKTQTHDDATAFPALQPAPAVVAQLMNVQQPAGVGDQSGQAVGHHSSMGLPGPPGPPGGPDEADPTSVNCFQNLRTRRGGFGGAPPPHPNAAAIAADQAAYDARVNQTRANAGPIQGPLQAVNSAPMGSVGSMPPVNLAENDFDELTNEDVPPKGNAQ